MSKRHRKPTASAKEVAKIAFTAAGSQRARAGCPLTAMPMKAQYIVRAGVLAVALGVGGAVATTPGIAFAEPTDTSSSGSSSDSSSSGSSSSTSSTGQLTENTTDTTDTTNQANDSKPDTPANTSAPEPSAPEPSEPSAPETSVAEPDTVSDLKPHVNDPETSVAKPGTVSAVEIEVRATKSAQPTKSRKAAKSEPPATEVEPSAVKQPTVAETADVAVARPAAPNPPSVNPPPTANPSPAPIAKTIVDSVQDIVKDPETQPPVPGEVSDAVAEVVSNILGVVGLNPFVSPDPAKPVPDSPAMWAMLAMARKQEDVAEPSSFGRMFGDLAPLNQQTTEQLRVLAQGMLEEAAIANPKGTTAGITFFGQFVDHDLTLDTLPQPDAPVDPTTLVNGRTFAFDLDSVYGGGPEKSPQLYYGDKFKLGVATDGVSPDLPRNLDGSAILIEPRNDENLIIAQIHPSFLRLHNALIDQGMSFDEAHDTVVNAYRYVVLHDYLPQIVGQDAVDAALKQPVDEGFYQPGKGTPFTPVEFSVAAFRFGHSQVRNAYNINDTSGGVPVFSLNGALDLHGGRQLPAIEDPSNGLKSLVIDFDNFFSELPREAGDDPALIGRAIDTNISLSLFQLPIPGAEGGGDNVLAFRNLLRAKFYDMPSGEAVAEAMGVPEELIIRDPVFPEGTPLWFYILREAEIISGGAELGPVGGGIVAEVFVDLLRPDDQAGSCQKKVNLPDVSGGDFRIGDLLVAADALEAASTAV